MLLNKEQIFSAYDLKSITVDVPEWGEGAQVKVKAMSAIDRINFEKCQDGATSSELVLRIVLLTCVDEQDNRIFSDNDLEQLQNKSPIPLLRIFNESIKLNTLNSDKLDEKAENFPQDHS